MIRTVYRIAGPIGGVIGGVVAALLGPPWLAPIVALVAGFATVTCAVLGLLSGMFVNALDVESRMWGVAGLGMTAVWLAHPMALLWLPTVAVVPVAAASIAASVRLTRFALGAAEAVARP